MNYPILSEYEIAIKKSGSTILNLNERFEFVVNRTAPIKFYNFGSGAFACVFKIKNQQNYQAFALRCFLNGGDPQRIGRIQQIIEYLSLINEPWLCTATLVNRGIYVKSHHFPCILMEWTSGMLLNEYVSEIINDNGKIDILQKKIAALSQALEKHGIAHGDIQSGNVLVEKNGSEIVLKLVDYDAMYIPPLGGQQAVETGHSSFQHSGRTKDYFDKKIDRFSFWLLLTALEALKYDKSLWNKDMQGGFNDGDNFLFRAKDIAHPSSSILVSRLHSLQQPSLAYYLDQLLSNHLFPQRDEVKLFGLEQSNITQNVGSLSEQKAASFHIDSDTLHANVFLHSITSLKLGVTPIILDQSYASKLIVLEKNGIQKSFYLNRNEKRYYIKLSSNVEREPAEAKTYEIYGTGGGLIGISKEEIEEMYKSGIELSYVFIDGKVNYIKNIPELLEIRNNYFNNSNFPPNTPIDKTPKVVSYPTKPQDKSFQTLFWFLVIGSAIVLATIFVVNSSSAKRSKTVDFESSTDTSVISEIESTNTPTPSFPPPVVKANPFDSKYSPQERAMLLIEQYLPGYELASDYNSNYDSYTQEFINELRNRNGNDFPYIVRGDFDGNSKFDMAFIAQKGDVRKLFVFLNSTSQPYFSIDLYGDGISYAEPDLYESFAGDGGTNESVNIVNDGFFMVYFQASATIYYYEGGTFKSFLISD